MKENVWAMFGVLQNVIFHSCSLDYFKVQVLVCRNTNITEEFNEVMHGYFHMCLLILYR